MKMRKFWRYIMANLKPRGLEQIRAKDSLLGDCIQDIVDSHNHAAEQNNASPVGQTPAPAAHTALNVTGGGGYFRAQITDASPGYRGKEHFLEVSEDKNFTAPHVVHLGASQTWYGSLGSKTLHFRSYAQYPTSAPSAPVYAMDVSGAGSAPPSIVGNGSGVGYGKTAFDTALTPRR